MKVQVQSEKFKNAILLSERITGKNLTLPVLGALLIVASGKTLKVRATNLSLGVELEIPASIEEEGTVLVKGDVLAGIVSNLGAEERITLSIERENIVLQTNKSKLIVKSLPNEEFPTLPMVQNENNFTIDPAVLLQGIRSVAFCAAVSDIKPEISALYFYTDQDSLFFVATDSFRLAEKKIKVKQLPEINHLLIPYKNIPEIIKILEVFTGEVRIEFTKNLISFSGNGVYLTSRLVDGVFPDYRQIIPKTWNSQCILLKQELLHTLRLASIFTDKFQQITFSLLPEEKKVVLLSKSPEIGENASTIEAALSGEKIEVNINLRYILDSFQALNGDSLSIEFTQPNRPLVVKSVSDPSFMYLIMPLNR